MSKFFLVLLVIAAFSVIVLNCEKTPSGTPSAFITVTYPNGGEYWTIGEYHSISWKSEGVGQVVVQISRDEGSSWDTIGWDPSIWKMNYYHWQTTGDTSSSCLIKVSDAANPSIYDISDSTFTIGYDTIWIISPNGGEVFLQGMETLIAWQSDEEFVTGFIYIYISKNKGSSWELLARLSENIGFWRWKVDKDGGDPSTNCLIKVVDISHAYKPYDVSDSTFTIVRPVKVRTPSGSEYRYPGDTLFICWITSGLGGNVEIKYTDGSSWYPIISSTPDTGWYVWEIPDTPGDEVKVLVTHLDYTEYFVNSDVSKGFTILRHLEITAPIVGDTLYTNQSYDIKWNTAGVPGKVRIDYWNGAYWDSIISSTPDTGSFAWLVPDTPTDSAKIEISHLRYYGNIATSNTFTIAKGP